MAEKDQHDQESGATADEQSRELQLQRQLQQGEPRIWSEPRKWSEPRIRLEHIIRLEGGIQFTVSQTTDVPPVEPPRREPRKWLLYIALFAVFQTAITVLFVLTVMRIRTPESRLNSAVVDALTYSPDAANPSFNIRINAEFSVENTNFGRCKFQDSSISFCYNGATVGSYFIRNSRAGARSTKRFDVMVDLSSAGLPNQPQLGADLSSGVLILYGRATLKGEVEVLGVLKTEVSAELDCSIAINLREGIVGDLSCN